ncbi:peptide chain release factor N(5)-glutamine methyltransferase [bacterium]|nr:peptide chain release factor N(5)-glutamine methyltransferase [bacterium]
MTDEAGLQSRALLIREAAVRLREAGVDDPLRDARLLLAHALALPPEALIADDARLVSTPDRERCLELVARRAAGEPVARIRGWRAFHGVQLAINQAVLDPRPDTELLVDFAVDALPRAGRVLDLGVGSGAILLAILNARPDATGCGVDLSAEAVDCARRNARALGLSGRAELEVGGWGSTANGLPQGPFDLVVSNPPYIRSDDIRALDPDVRLFDPVGALDGGPDGLAAYAPIIDLSRRLLAPGGWLAVEIGLGQEQDVLGLFKSAEYQQIRSHRDLAGHVRMICARTLPVSGGPGAEGMSN